MHEHCFEELSKEIHNGVTKKGHPFRTITLATVSNGTNARICTVVLREVSKNLTLTIYTDSRSEKINNIRINNRASLLFYHPEKLLQLKIEGVAELVNDTDRLKTIWNGIQVSSKRDYTTTVPPSTEISNPDDVAYLEDENYFAMIDIVPSKIEYLKLKRPNHIRVAFNKDGLDWNATFLVP